MKTLEMQMEALMRLCTAEKEADWQKAKAEVMGYLSRTRQPLRLDPEYLVRELLLELGAPDHLVGHPYVVEAILLVVENRAIINSITFGLYPQIAAKFDTTAARVERAIRHLVEVTWTRGDLKVLNRYFGNTVDACKGKPTNGEFIARLANVVRQKMKDAAA